VAIYKRSIPLFIVILWYLPSHRLFFGEGGLVAGGLDNAPLFRVDRHKYTMSDIVGISEKQLRAEFDEEIAHLSDERVVLLLRRVTPFQKVSDALKEQDRRRRIELLWNNFRRSLILNAARQIILYHTSERIIRFHGSDARDYFEVKPLRDALERQVKYFDFMLAHRLDPYDKDDVLYSEAVKRFRYQWKKEMFVEAHAFFRSQPRFTARYSDYLRAFGQSDDHGITAVLLNHLLQDVCQNGYYHRKAKEYFQFRHSELRVFTIVNYYGSKESLQKYFDQVIGHDGDVAEKGIGELKAWLNDFSPRVMMKQKRVLGGDAFSKGGLPNNRYVYEVGPGEFKIYAVRRSRPQKSDATPDRHEMFYRKYAYRFATADYQPDCESYVVDLSLNPLELLEPVFQFDATSFWRDVKIDKFIKKPYPSLLFEEFATHRADIEELTVTAARLSLESDQQACAELLETLDRKAQSLRSSELKRLYKALRDRLSDKLKASKP